MNSLIDHQSLSFWTSHPEPSCEFYTYPNPIKNGEARGNVSRCYWLYVSSSFAVISVLVSKLRYSGGTILSTLLNTKNDFLEHCNLSLLVRGNDKARVFEAKGLKTVLFDDLGDTQEIERIASNYDCARFVHSGKALSMYKRF